MKVNASSIETLDKALNGFKWLFENHGALVLHAEVDIEGESFPVEREGYAEENGTWVVKF